MDPLEKLLPLHNVATLLPSIPQKTPKKLKTPFFYWIQHQVTLHVASSRCVNQWSTAAVWVHHQPVFLQPLAVMLSCHWSLLEPVRTLLLDSKWNVSTSPGHMWGTNTRPLHSTRQKKKTWDLFCDITTDSGKYLGHLDFLCLNLAIIRVGVKG